MANLVLKSSATKRLQQKFGKEFPKLDEKDGKLWAEWFKAKREEQSGLLRDRRVHWSRHRNFRMGNQWIAMRDGKTWQTPGADKNVLRPVDNHVGPALDFRHGLIMEQKPGFRHDLLSATIKAREEAEAQQAVAEHYFRVLKAHRTFADAVWNAQSDGVCFAQVWFDPLGGAYQDNVIKVPETDPRYKGLVAQGYEVEEQTGAVLLPLSEGGDKVLEPGESMNQVSQGDLATRVVLAHDTMADAEARVLNGDGSDAAKWFLIRRPRDLSVARIETGDDELQADMQDVAGDPTDYPTDQPGFQRGLPPFPAARRKFKEMIYDYTLFIAPDGQDLQDGIWRRVVGGNVVEQGDELPGKVIPFAQFTDGSPDPSLYPRPLVSDWIGDQIAINAIQALIMQHGRILGIGRLLANKGTILSETYNTVIGSVLEYEGMKPEQLQTMRASVDLWELLKFKIKKLEDKSGFNDLARGQVLGSAGGGMQDVSGRAVLGAMEMLERTFGPMVQATAEGASQWAEIVVKYAAWMFGDTPRQIENVGGRGDLAKNITKEMLGSACHVYCDAATMMPMPAQLRQELLDTYRKEGLISLQAWAKRSPYAEARNASMGDLDHWQRAEWINSVLEENWETFNPDATAAAPQMDPATGQPMPPAMPMPPEQLYGPDGLPVWWQDDPTAHLGALNEIILDERKPFNLRKLAADRAGLYEQLAQAKADPLQPVPAEILGVPLNRLQLPPGMQAPVQMAGASAAAGPTGGPSAPMAGPSEGTPMSEPPAPLGTVGKEEANLRK